MSTERLVRAVVPPRRPWTASDSRWLVRLYRHGWTIERMAEAMDRGVADLAAAIVTLGEAGWLRPCDYGSHRRDEGNA